MEEREPEPQKKEEAQQVAKTEPQRRESETDATVIRHDELQDLLRKPTMSVAEQAPPQLAEHNAVKDEQIQELSNMVKQLMSQQQDLKL